MMRQQIAPIANDSLFQQAIVELRKQLWSRLMIFVLVALVGTRLVRYLDGVESTVGAIVIQVIVYAIVILGLLLRNSRYAPLMQTVFLLTVHLIVPVVALFYGGARGFADLALIGIVVLSSVYGFQRWMIVTLAISAATMIYVVYLEMIGQPLAPFLADAQRFASIKMIMLILLVATIIAIGYRFYSRLLAQHQALAEEQLHLTNELQQSTQELTRLSAELTQSRQNIVTTREEERRRLRHELQDQLGPTLASLSYRAGAARYTIRRQPAQVKPELDALESNIKETLSQVRTFVYALHPPMLDQLGLSGAIRQYVTQLNLPFSAEINTEDVPKDLNAAAEVVTFDLVQTVLECTKSTLWDCTLDLAAQADTLHIDILLDGTFSAESLRSQPAMQTVFSRVDELGGSVLIEAGDSAEIKLHGTIPL